MSKPNNDYYFHVNKIDKILDQTDLSEELANQIQKITSKNISLNRYFISSLIKHKKEAWFTNLQSFGFFEDLINLGNNQENQFITVNKFRYLEVCAQSQSKEVFSLIERIKPGNQFLFNELVKLISKQKSDSIIKYYSILENWIESGVLIESKEYLSIIDKLEKCEKWKYAKKFIKIFLSPKNNSAEEKTERSSRKINDSIAQNYLIKYSVSTLFTKYIKKYPKSMVDIGIYCLKMNPELEIEISWSRSAIEESDQNIGEIYGDYLITIVRDALIELIKSNNVIAEKKLFELLQKEISIYPRLAIYVIGKQNEILSNLTPKLYEKNEIGKFILFHHEYWHFIANTFESQENNVKADFLDFLIENYDNSRDEYHLLRWLFAVKDCLLGNYKDRYDELLSKYGPPDHPDFLSYSKNLGGPLSPVDKEELLKMTRGEIVEELKKDIPVEGYGEIAQEGFDPVLQEAVKEDPAKFAELSEIFDPRSIPPSYVDHFLRGLRDGWKLGKDFDWITVVNHCVQLFKLSDEDFLVQQHKSWRTTSKNDIQRSILWLLSAAVRTKDHNISSEHFTRIRNLIINAFDHLDQDSIDTERIKNTPSGIFTLALNENRAIAVEVLINYALLFAKETYRKDSKTVERMESEVKTCLEEILQNNHELTVHSIFGKYFPNLVYLNEEWSKYNIQTIFPLEEDLRTYFVAAWGSYLYRGDFFNNVYEMLKDQHKLGIDLLNQDNDFGTGLNEAIHRIYYPLYFAFWRGLESMFGEESLIQNFLKIGSDNDIANFVRGLGDGLQTVQPKKDDDRWRDMKNLWKDRFSSIHQQQPDEKSQELSAYLSWIPYFPEEITKFYDDILFAALHSDINMVFELMNKLVKKQSHMTFLVKLLNRILDERINEPWILYRKDDLFDTILKHGMTMESEIRDMAIFSINKLGELGLEQYRDLLDI
jgi:hypothetical protein